MKKQICALLLCLAALFSLAGCGTKPKTPVKGQNEPNPVKAQACGRRNRAAFRAADLHLRQSPAAMCFNTIPPPGTSSSIP